MVTIHRLLPRLLSASRSTFQLIKYSTMSQQKISFPSDNKDSCPGMLQGDVSKTTKGLVVLQEWWGMNQQIINEAKEIGEKGPFVTIVPDLYRGKVATDREGAGHLMSGLDWPGAVKDIQGAAKYLKSIGCKKVGVTGFCMGGALVLAAAVHVPEIDAAAPFYGIPGDDLVDVRKIKIPLECHYGEKDDIEGFSSPKDQEALKKKLDEGGVKYQFHSYDAGHGFANKTKPNFNQECCDMALNRMIKFMSDNLA